MTKKKQTPFRFHDIFQFMSSLYGEDLHAKRVYSLANATLEVMTSAALACKPSVRLWRKHVDYSPNIMRVAYSVGEFIFAATGGGKDLPFGIYGQAIIPASYVTKNWLADLEMVDFVNDPKVMPQALIGLKNRAI